MGGFKLFCARSKVVAGFFFDRVSLGSRRTLARGLVLGTVMLVCSSCVYGPKAERKTPLSYLNGENYESAPQGPDKYVVAMAKRKDRTTHLRGRVVRKEGLVEVPVKQAVVKLSGVNDGTRLETRTDLNGDFVLAGVIPNGSYFVSAEAVFRKGSDPATATTAEVTSSKLVHVNSYDIDNIVLDFALADSSAKPEPGQLEDAGQR